MPGINDGTKPTATGPNGQLRTIGSVRVTLEPKPGLPTDPNDVRAAIDLFTDISGLFVINNESGWYEGWMIHDLRVPRIAPPRANGRAQYGTITPEDAAAIRAVGSHNNVPAISSPRMAIRLIYRVQPITFRIDKQTLSLSL